MLTVLTIAGGVALILFGVRYLRKGLDRLFGHRLNDWLGRMADNRFKSFLAGVLLSMAVPSSTAMSVLAAQTAQAGKISAKHMLAVMLGVNIGVTLPVVLIALRLEQYAPVFVFVGVALFQFTSYNRSRGVGQTVLAMGFIFLGVDTIKAAAAVAAHDADLLKLIEIAGHHPLAMAGLAAVLTFALQSGTATLGMVIGLGAEGVVTLPLALVVVTGTNVGIVMTTLLVGWNKIESRRLAVANLLGKAVVAGAVLACLPLVAEGVARLPGGLDRHVAWAHIGFNVALAVVALPLVSVMVKLIEAMTPQPPATVPPVFGPRYINTGPIDSLSIALDQSLRETLHVSEIVRGMLGDLWRSLKSDDSALALNVCQRDDQVDLLDAQIKRFLTRQFTAQGDHDDPAEEMRQLRYLNELENSGDIIDKNLAELVLKKIKLGADFSEEGWQELDEFYGMVTENMLIADTVFSTRDRMLAQQLLRHKERLNEYERQLRDNHFARLRAGLPESFETSAIHLDLLTHLKRINSCVSHVAYAILQDESGGGQG